MSKELFEALMKEVRETAAELGYSEGAAAGDFLDVLYCTLDAHFQGGDHKDFVKYAKSSIDEMRKFNTSDRVKYFRGE